MPNTDSTGQHFMTDAEIIKFIVNSAKLKSRDIVLEIGYGKGALTQELVKKCNVIAIDIDKRQLNLSSKKLELVHGNVLEVFEALKADYKFNKIVANIPYNISEPLMKRLFRSDFDMAVFTVGKNFSEILKSKNNRISVIANNLFKISYLKDVPKSAFNPKPSVDSKVIRITRIMPEKLGTQGKLYRDLVFLDEKTVRNGLEKIIQNESTLKNYTKKKLSDLIDKHLVKDICNKRLYELSNIEFLKLDKFLEKLK